MNTRFKHIATILIFGFIAIAAMTQEDYLNNSEVDNNSSDLEIIRNIIEKQYPDFVRSSDAEGYASQFTSDALWMPQGEVNRKGPEAIAESIGEEFKVMQLRPAITIQEISIQGDYAFVIGRDELTIIPKNGSSESKVVYTVLWFLRKIENQWKIARQIWNEKPIGN